MPIRFHGQVEDYFLRRDPYEKAKNDYFRSINIRKIRPRIFYHQCDNCGYEYKNETMYECSTSDPSFAWTNYYVGCTHCFHDKDNFRKWLENKGYIYTHDNYTTYAERLLKKIETKC